MWLSKFISTILVVIAYSLAGPNFAFAQRAPAPNTDLNTVLMHATFEIIGPKINAQGQSSFGTVFVMGRPHDDDPKIEDIVIVTAAHVLDEIAGDTATLILRRPAPDGTYTSYPFTLPIRERNPLYIKHSSADVAVMYADLPNDVPMSGVPPALLADDKRLADIEVHPGDEVFVLGFPLAAQGPGGFPILRSGHIASYPLVPEKVVKQFDLDVFLFGGNSGGPVYFSYSNRIFKNSIHFGTEQGVLGLIVQTTSSMLPGYIGTSLNFGVVLPAQFIREAIDMLPSRNPESAHPPTTSGESPLPSK